MVHVKVFVCLFIVLLPALFAVAAEKPNVLFIAVDDLRTELGCYGKSSVRSPNIDRLASQGTLFDHAYCMVSVCGVSRASLMTGMRPKPNRFVGAHLYASKDAPDAVPLNVHFKNNGYATVNNGKVFHFSDDHKEGWSEPAWRPKTPSYALPESIEQVRVIENNIAGKNVNVRVGPSWECADVSDDTYGDGKTLKKSLTDLRQLAEAKKPFFLAVGFLKPTAKKNGFFWPSDS